jgi:hypothetical protein
MVAATAPKTTRKIQMRTYTFLNSTWITTPKKMKTRNKTAALEETLTAAAMATPETRKTVSTQATCS